MTKRIRVAVLCSGSASSYRFVDGKHDPEFEEAYEVVCVISDVPDVKGIAYAKEHGVPHHVLDYRKWCQDRGVKRGDLESRNVYFSEMLTVLEQYKPDVLMLSGFMLILTRVILEAFAGRILNVHPAFLRILNEFGKRKHRGDDAVTSTMEAGDPTGSTVHIVTEEPDGGPIVAESDELPYKEGDKPSDHQELMKTECDGPAYLKAFKILREHGWPERPWP